MRGLIRDVIAASTWFRSAFLAASLAASALSFSSGSNDGTPHVWEKVEITLHSERTYANPYTDVKVWVDLKGPGYEKRCYGFWDGGDTFRVRVVATAPGKWTWQSASQPADRGLGGAAGHKVNVELSTAGQLDGSQRRQIFFAAAVRA